MSWEVGLLSKQEGLWEEVEMSGRKASPPGDALKYAQDGHGVMPKIWAADGSGYFGQLYNIPVLKDKPTETLKEGDVQLIVELMITTMGIEGYRNALPKTDNQVVVHGHFVADTENGCTWEHFSGTEGKSMNATGRLFQKILGQMEDNNLKQMIEKFRSEKEHRGEMYMHEDC